ncbi:MAG TPA: hypothetical protein QGF70_04925 [Candidatus Thalassarchaeaceae archaeon]|jgi:hypothetical protein|nr:hypothetical protein [Candidatus Thalassarchaeaceae archaeon]MDP7092578.1 hypothetical protein [Candidatus Thalassarchaeaceae archaeon]HJL64911.1 hypothetical protein [Candidatus Thalassarchaeaceae archaeon]HJO85096.1 hypothetical protein [Candidatus Thalassarchaeaceae archaeon]|tara:strand:+ start:352 stop:627 length:276 start_codon:yes stop_codon:yes gene_type:complete
MEYTVVQTNSIDHLKDVVREKIASGWVPLGGLNVYSSRVDKPGPPDFYQAMVRKSADIAASKNQITDLKTEINYLNDELTEWLEDQRAEDI